MKNLSNEQLLQRYHQADVKAFEEFFNRNKKIVFNFLKMKLGHQGDAEEAMQETFMRVHRFVAKYDSSQNAMSWVFSIAKNTAYDIYYKNRRQRDIKSESKKIDRDSGSSAEFSLIAKQELDEILKQLTPNERELIEMRFIKGESFDDIADQLNIKPGGARQKISRLLRKIRGFSIPGGVIP